MNVLVTGGAGFIGSHLIDQLIAQDHTVFCYDNFLTGSRHNIQHLQDNAHFTFFKRDVSAPFKPPASIDQIYHLASPASPRSYQELPFETIAVNTKGTQLLLELAHTHKASFLFASTSEVYGDPKEHPQNETYWGHVNPIGPRACYDESKRLGETLTMQYIRSKNVDARIIRIFNTYGPRLAQADGRVVGNFIKQALAKESLTVYGDGLQTRSFCYIDDLVFGIIGAMNVSGTRGEVVNIGNPDEHTVLDLAHLVLRLTGATTGIQHKPLPQDDPTRRRPDITKAYELLSWAPQVSIEDGLQRTIAWFRTVYA